MGADAAKKNPPDCALSAEADIYTCNARLLQLAGEDVQIEEPDEVCFLGIKAKIGARVILHPSFGISLEHMKTKVKGKVRISKKSTLVIEGPTTIDGLDLDGAVTFKGSGTHKDTVVKNSGQPLMALTEEELAARPPGCKIRGYRKGDGEMETRE